jgi:hypothetical protein
MLPVGHSGASHRILELKERYYFQGLGTWYNTAMHVAGGGMLTGLCLAVGEN